MQMDSLTRSAGLIFIAKPRMIGYPLWRGSTAENGMSE